MAKAHTTPSENAANQQNGNWGTSGTNSAWDARNGNRGGQMNPNNSHSGRK